LSRLKPARIVVVGGTAVVSASVQSQLAGYTTTGTVTRLAGSNRYATAAEISKSKFSPGVPVAHISTGLNFPDALAASPAAALNGGPMLLVDPSSIPSATAAELSRLRPGRIVIVGGTAAVSAAVESQLAKFTTGTVTRLAEANRYATAAEISKAKIAPGVPIAFIATGLNFPDALAGGPVAGYSGKGVSPILLVEQNAIPSATRAELTRLKPHSIVILGGSAVVSDQVKADLAQYTAP
ncbi:MAG: cell wall-binding repeat-containing protein, partial [Actinomycetota bacterium]|nr:cell wall-binding repeat-containing protein [Actinomycetota bacterium]